MTPKAAKTEIEAVLKEWRERLLLQEWHIDASLAEALPPDESSPGECLADISVDSVYLRAKMRIFPVWGQRDRPTREAALVHELCHCVTQPLRDLLNDARLGQAVRREEVRDRSETLTQRVANIAMAAARHK